MMQVRDAFGDSVVGLELQLCAAAGVGLKLQPSAAAAFVACCRCCIAEGGLYIMLSTSGLVSLDLSWGCMHSELQ